MSTYSDSFRFQRAIAVHVSTGTFGTTEASQKFRLTIPVDWDHFWENTKNNFFDVVLTDNDGVTLLTFGRVAGADHPTRVLKLDVDGWTAPSGVAVCLVWLHYGDAGAAADPAPGATPTSPTLIPFNLARPGGWMAKYGAGLVGRTLDAWTKRTDEIRDLWVRFPMAKRGSTSRGTLGLEWPHYIKVELFNSTPTLQPTMTDFSRAVFAGSEYCRVDLRLGTTANAYSLLLTLTTNLGQRLVYPATLNVQD